MTDGIGNHIFVLPADKSLSAADLQLFLSCLSSLCVRNEYCSQLSSSGGTQAVSALLLDPDTPRPVVGEALRLLKALCGNDDVKRDVGQMGGAEIVVNAVGRHMVSRFLPLWASLLLDWVVVSVSIT